MEKKKKKRNILNEKLKNELMFKNKTKYSKKEYEEFLESYKEEYALTENLYILFYLVFFGLCSYLAIKDKQFILGIGIILGLIIYLWYKIIRPLKRVEKDKQSEKTKGNYVINYEFYTNYIKSKSPEGEAQTLYFKLYRVVETDTHFYIYLSREYAFLVSKSGFENDKYREFSTFIKKKVKSKYRNRKKIKRN